MYTMPPTPYPFPVPLRPVSDDPIEELRYEMVQGHSHIHARLDRVEDRQAANLDLAVEAIRASNAQNAKKTAAWVSLATALLTALGVIVAAYLKAAG